MHSSTFLLLSAMLLSAFSLNTQAESKGITLFAANCSACHNVAGTGIPGIAPPLAGALGQQLSSPLASQYFSQVMIAGLAGKIRVDGQLYSGVMPAQAHLADDDLIAILGYVAHDLNQNPTVEFTAESLAQSRANAITSADNHALRKQILKEQRGE